MRIFIFCAADSLLMTLAASGATFPRANPMPPGGRRPSANPGFMRPCGFGGEGGGRPGEARHLTANHPQL